MGISIAEYMRRLVRRDLADEPPRSPPEVSALFGIGDSGDSGGADVATNKQRYVAEAVAGSKTDR